MVTAQTATENLNNSMKMSGSSKSDKPVGNSVEKSKVNNSLREKSNTRNISSSFDVGSKLRSQRSVKKNYHTAKVTASTASSKAKRSSISLVKVPEMPFVAGKIGKSFHVPSNVQKAIAMINHHTNFVSETQSNRRSPIKPKNQPCSKVEKHDEERESTFIQQHTYLLRIRG